MCLPPATVDERVTRLSVLLGAACQLISANAETGEQTFSGALAVLHEVETGLHGFAAELKACSSAADAR